MKDINPKAQAIMEALRGAGYFNPSEVEYAILETNGNMSVMPKAQNRPLSPADVDIDVQKSEIPVAVIMEGEFVGENLGKIAGDIKEKVLAFLTKKNLDRKDVLVALVAGEQVFVQPYKDDFIISSLGSQTDNPHVVLGDDAQ